MSLFLTLMIFTGLLPVLGASMILVVWRDTPDNMNASPEALCCPLGCSGCPGLDANSIDGNLTESPFCKCDPLCAEYGDCCPGYVDRCPPDRRSDRSSPHGGARRGSLECVPTSNAEKKMFQDAHGFFMVSGCPAPTVTDWGVAAQLCRELAPDFGAFSTDELNETMRMLPVASTVTGLHYKNIYCALCNGSPAGSLVPWLAGSVERQGAITHERYWFEPPDGVTSAAVNVTRPRTCVAGVTLADSTSLDSPAEACSRIPPDVETELRHSDKPCLACIQRPTTAVCVLQMSSLSMNFKIPFDFPSFVEETERSYGRPVSCPDGLLLDHTERRCVRAGSPSTSPPSAEGLCNPWGGDVTEVHARLSLADDGMRSPKDLLADIRSALREGPGSVVPELDVVSKNYMWNPLVPHSGSQSFQIPRCQGGVCLTTVVLSLSGFNSTSERSLGFLADRLLAGRANLSYHVVAVEYMLPCGNYSVDQCLSDLSDTVGLKTDTANMTNGSSADYSSTDNSHRPHRLLRRIRFGTQNQTDASLISKTSQLLLCDPENQENGLEHALQLLYVTGTVVSLVGLSLTFAAYSVLPDLRTVPGVGTMNLVAATFSAQLGLLLAGRATAVPGLCTSVAVLLHYVWLASFTWTSCLALGLSRSLASPTGTRRLPDGGARARRTARLNALYGWGAPLAIVASCLVVHFATRSSSGLLEYGTGAACWIQPKEANLVVFGLPVLMSLLANAYMFGKAVRGIRASRKATRCLKSHVSFVQRAREEMAIYVKVSMLMGLSWFWGFLGAFTDIRAFWFLFVLSNSCQGGYVFVSFVCNRRVLRMLGARCRRGGGRRADQSRAATCQMTRFPSDRMARVSSHRNSGSTVV